MTTPEYAVELKRSLEAAYEKVRQTTVPNRKCRGNSTTDECMGICTRLETTFGYILRYCPERTPRSCIIHGLAYRVIKRLPDSTYRIQLLRAPHKRLVVHFNWLKPCGDAIEGSPPAEYTSVSGEPVPEPPVTGTRLDVVEPEDIPAPSEPHQPSPPVPLLPQGQHQHQHHRRCPCRNCQPPKRFGDLVLI